MVGLVGTDIPLDIIQEILMDMKPFENSKVDIIAHDGYSFINEGIMEEADSILARIRKDEKFIIDRTIDVHIKNLRDKLEEAGQWIRSIRGVGYKLEP